MLLCGVLERKGKQRPLGDLGVPGGQAGIRGTYPLQRQTLIAFSGGSETVYLILSTDGDQRSSVGFDLYFYHGPDPDLLLMGKQKCAGLICLAPRSQK